MKKISQLEKVLNYLYFVYNTIDSRNQKFDYIHSTYYQINTVLNLYQKDINSYVSFLEGNGKICFSKKQTIKDNQFREKKKYQKNKHRNIKKDKNINNSIKKRKFKKVYPPLKTKIYKTKFNRSIRRDIKSALKSKDWREYSRFSYTENENNSFSVYYADNEWDNFQEKGRKVFRNPNDWW